MIEFYVLAALLFIVLTLIEYKLAKHQSRRGQ